MYESIARRRFLSLSAGAIAGSSLIGLSVTPAEAQTIQLIMRSVAWLGEHVLVPMALSAFDKWLDSAKLLRTEEDGSFHDHFNSGFAFDRPFNPQKIQFPGYMGVDRSPLLSTGQNLPREGELNLAEIGELQNTRNPNLWSGDRLLLAPIPTSLRERPRQQDLQMMGYDLSRFGQDPSNYRVEYGRTFCDCSGVRLRGLGWSSVEGNVGFRILQV